MRIIKKSLSKLLLVLLCFAVLVGCGEPPKSAFQASENTLKTRQLQSKKFETVDQNMMLASATAVLQDMGFMINESESKLGLLVGSKSRETDNKGQRYALVALSILAGSGSLQGIEQSHNIRVSVATNPDKENKNTVVRVNFQREVFDMEGNLTRRETLHEQDIYQGFFDKLSKSVFLQAHEV